MKTIGEIKQEFSSQSAAILNRHFDDVAQIGARRELADGAYLDRLNPEQRMSVLQEEKTEESKAVGKKAREAYEEEYQSYRKDLDKRSGYLTGRLFKVEDAGALSRAALATDTELSSLMDIATKASNVELGRAVFVVAEKKGMGDLMKAFFDNLDPEARELYAEYKEIPPQEILERQAQGARLIRDPDPSSLMPRAVAF